ATGLVYGTLENQLKIDYALDRLMDHPTREPVQRDILRMGAYQILFLDRVPDSAAVDEAVKLDRKSTRLNSSHVSISYAVFCLHVRPLPSPPSLLPYTTLFRSGYGAGIWHAGKPAENRLCAGPTDGSSNPRARAARHPAHGRVSDSVSGPRARQRGRGRGGEA